MFTFRCKMNAVIGLCLILVNFALAKSYHRYDFSYEDSTDVITTEVHKEFDEYLQNSKDYHRAHIDEFPYHVAVIRTEPATGIMQLVCQGALVTNSWFLTSARCIWSNSVYLDPITTKAVIATVDYTSPLATRRSLSNYILHPLFNRTTGVGNDIAMWKLEIPVLGSFFERVIHLNDLNQIPLRSNCKYTSYIGHNLYWNQANLKNNVDNCSLIGVRDDLNICVELNNHIHIVNMYSDQGSPLVCGDKLYALRNADGYFTTVLEIGDFLDLLINDIKRPINKHNDKYKYQPAKLHNDYDQAKKQQNNNDLTYPIKAMHFITSSGDYRPIQLTGQDEYFRVINSQKIDSDENESFNNEIGLEQNEEDDSSRSISISFRSEASESSSRLRRSVKASDYTELEHLFLGWAQTISGFKEQRKIHVTKDIGKMVGESEMEELIDKKNE